MSAFTNGFNFGFVSGMFNRMFGSFNPFCGCNFFGGFNFTPTFFTPTFNTSIFTQYPMPAVKMPPINMTSVNMSFQNFPMPMMNNTFDWSSVNMDNLWPSVPMGDSFSSSKALSSSSFVPTKAKSYANMSDAEMKKIYGNYTRNVTSLYNGTAAELNKHLKNRGVLAGKGQAFLNAQKKYGISASVLAAICIQETGGTSSNARTKNNVGNISKGKGWQTYSSVEEGINAVASLLRKKYVSEGLTALYQINAKYCPVQDNRASAASQSAWAGRVNKITDQIETA